MKLTEDLAKSLLRRHGLPVPDGAAARTAEEAGAIAREYGGAAVVKALIAAGRRGKQGLVTVVENEEAAARETSRMLGAQAFGNPITRIYVERRATIARELYLSFAFTDQNMRMVICCEGGVDIETTYARSPEKIVVADVDPLRGLKAWDAVGYWADAGLKGQALAAVGRLTASLYDAFVACDAVMMEINPLTLDDENKPLLVGSMMEIDDSALFRQPRIEAEGISEASANPREAAVILANRSYPGGESRYTELDGNIGLLVAGGGAGLLQHDMIVELGGKPANHTDVSPAPGTEKLEAILDAIFTNPRSRSLLIGYNYLQMARCDQIAEALRISVERNRVNPGRFPIVMRVFGPEEKKAREIAAAIPGVNYLAPDATLEDGCRMIVELTRQAAE
jgi:succinyl-CoA synthetase beta subunit/citryl-CoA synthetase large subunit